MTLIEIIRRSEEYLAGRGIARARREAEEVIADSLGMKRLDLYLQFDRPLHEVELVRLRHVMQRRAAGEPSAYIAGKVSFSNLELQVTSDVLIPRPETEILVEKIALTLKLLPIDGKVLWDMCCGSGCIGLALKKRFPQLIVILSDFSERALAIAKKNAAHNLLDVQFMCGDLFEPFQGKQCDFFICNPPYVAEEEYAHLSAEVHQEPKMALVAGNKGMEFYVRIAQALNMHLKSDGLGWLEIGSGQGTNIKFLFEDKGWRCRFESDWAGHDRFFFLAAESQSAPHNLDAVMK